jgi:hypothetical protein
MTIRELMRARGIKNVDLAKHIHMDPARVSLCVNGLIHFPRKYQDQVCEFLGVDHDELRRNRVGASRLRPRRRA